MGGDELSGDGTVYTRSKNPCRVCFERAAERGKSTCMQCRVSAEMEENEQEQATAPTTRSLDEQLLQLCRDFDNPKLEGSEFAPQTLLQLVQFAAAVGAELAYEDAAKLAESCRGAEDYWGDKLPDAIRSAAQRSAGKP
jgi:hypothetical protein